MTRLRLVFSTLQVVVSIFLLVSCCPASLAAGEFDPYTVLGVGRSATQAEVKKVYKKLAREWHPDKNKSPGAEDMFIKITKSYELLSNEEKRANYDRYGETAGNQGYAQQQRQQFQHFHDSFYFDESFFHYQFNKGSRDFADTKYMLHFSQYMNDIVPDSFKRPYLIKITSDWCFSCIHIEPVWKEVVQELEALGMGIGVVDVGYERRLANHLGAHRTPSILGLINGKVTFFHYAVVREHLRQFVENLLPARLVEKVTDQNYMQFLNSWHEENKPHVLLFDQVPVLPLLYKLTAFAYKDYVRFGYVDQGLVETEALLQQYKINTYAPTMLLFKESTDKPADIIQARGMKKQIIDEFISNNKFLLVPRLVNQKLFEELCPVKQFHRRRKYCVLLVTSGEDSFTNGNEEFLSFAASNTKEIFRFAYVYQKQQQALCDVLLKDKESVPSQVLILERRNTAGKVSYKAVPGGWNGSEEEKFQLQEQLELLQKDPAFLTSVAVLPELNNEFASMFLLQWIYAAYHYVSQIGDDLLYNNCRAPKKSFVEVTELTDLTYTSNLVRLRPGHMNVMLVLTDAAKNALLSKFAKEVYSFTGSLTLHFSFLNLDKHKEWMESLLEFAQDAVQIDSDEDDSQHKADYTGYVLALNGHKKYLCLFKPVYTGEDLHMDSSRASSSSRDEAATRKKTASSSQQIHHKLDRLGLWIERLLEGTLPRYYIPSWPGLDKITTSK
ncbi:UNVERIFIED_CONTAM: hypothetical protein FKN15_073940 [Acipenser sinensis]